MSFPLASLTLSDCRVSPSRHVVCREMLALKYLALALLAVCSGVAAQSNGVLLAGQTLPQVTVTW